MDVYERIKGVYESSHQITITNCDKVVIMSDVHRSNGSTSDQFIPNQNIMLTALRHYFANDYLYIEAGDGDELWMNKGMAEIKQANRPVFEILEKFYDKERLYMLYGNHDMKKRKPSWASKPLTKNSAKNEQYHRSLTTQFESYEGVRLYHRETGHEILVLHGHQADFLNYDLWWLSKWLVRYVWQPLSLIGIKDPTSASDSGKKKGEIEEKLGKWASKENKIIIAGHTHKSVFPKPGEPLYFNDGCCVHPRYITAIEIECGRISLVKWCVNARDDGTLYVAKEIINEPVSLAIFN